jgi:hypothetical protein
VFSPINENYDSAGGIDLFQAFARNILPSMISLGCEPIVLAAIKQSIQ